MSNEITGYAASILAYLFRVTGEEEYLDAARGATRFLLSQIQGDFVPYECQSDQVYFFDTGIIVRGLLAVWRVTNESSLLEAALAAAKGMPAFWSGADYHPILTLPSRTPTERTAQWSRSPGCYQAKSALAWWELAQVTGDTAMRQAYLDVVTAGIRTHRDFLAGAPDRLSVMDRLHAYCYFLEGMTPLLGHPPSVAAYSYALSEVAGHLRDLAQDFARADVYAQLLRARVSAAAVIPIDMAAASEEAAALLTFEAATDDPRLDGAFLFGRRGGKMSPHASPVPTTFAIQALTMWQAFQAGAVDPCPQLPI